MVGDAENLIGDYIEPDLTRTNNPFHILQQYGIEAALACIKELFWEQMNGVNEEDRQKVKGMGELDYRYIDALVDTMGSTGVLHGLGKSGQMVATVTSLLGGIGGEDPGYSLRAHTQLWGLTIGWAGWSRQSPQENYRLSERLTSRRTKTQSRLSSASSTR